MDDDPPCLIAGLAYTARGWPAFALKPHSKEPITKHGVKDATLDDVQLRRWWHRWPDANIAIACGAPGPQALDIDNLEAGHDALIVASKLGGPEVATARGRQFYLQGSSTGTIGLGYGELRGVGSYVVAPPSIHPTGKQYTFLVEPGSAPLPRVPSGLIPVTAGTAGTGVLDAPAELIPHGQRHEALKDMTVRLVRSGVLDLGTLELLLRDYFAARFVQTPKPRKDEFAKLAAWGVKTQIADRERTFSDWDEEPATKKRKRDTGLGSPPRGDAPLKEHRDYLRIAGGWGDRIDIERIHRHGTRSVDGLELWLSNGQVIEFEQQGQITSRGHWARTLVMGTGGIARPVALNELEALAVLRSLCILAGAPPVIREAEAIGQHIRDFLEAAVVWNEHDLSTPGGRFDLVKRAGAHGLWDPRKSAEEPPVVIVDRADNRRYVRSSEVFAWLNAAGAKLSPLTLPGRMAMAGGERWMCVGREARRLDTSARRTGRIVLYRLAEEEGGE